MADKYANYEALAAVEKIGVDYEINTQKRKGAKSIIFTPHGGSIEAGTSELVKEVAKGYHNWYDFAGIKSTGNTDLHITSTNFDEPQALQMLGEATHAMSLHGYSDSVNAHTEVGGLDSEMVEIVIRELQKEGFSASVATGGIAGLEPTNITNRTSRGMGVQLELSTLQRRNFFTNDDFSSANRGNTTDTFKRYVRALRRAMNKSTATFPFSNVKGGEQTDNIASELNVVTKKQKNASVDVKVDFGAVGSGSHPLSERFSTLTDAQKVYPSATALTDEIDWCAIQAALDYSAVNNTVVYFPNGSYRTNKPLVMYGANNETTSGTRLLGQSFEGVKIIKQTSDVLSSSYPFNTNAVLIVVNENYRGKIQNNTLDNTTENVDKVFIENIMFEGQKDAQDNRLVDYGIFMPINTFSSCFTSLRLREFKESGVKNKGNFFLNRFQQVRSERAGIGFDLGEVGKINTSIHMNGCYAVSCDVGYKVRGIYNELDCCCGDAIKTTVFDLTGFHGTLNTPGAESQYVKTLFLLNESTVTINGAYTFGNYDDAEHIHVKASANSKAVFNGGNLMVDWTEAGRTVPGKLYQNSTNSSITFEDTIISSKYQKNNDYGDTKVYNTMKNRRGGVNYRDYGTTVQSYIGHDAKDVNGGFVDESSTNPRIPSNAIFFGHGKDAQTLIDGQSVKWNARTNIGDIMLTRNILGTGGIGWVNWLDRSRDLAFKGTVTASTTGQITLSDVMLADYDKYGVYAPTLRPIQSSSGGTGTISSIDYTNNKISIASMAGTWNVGDTVFIPKTGANTDVVVAKIPIIHSGTSKFRPKDSLVDGQTYYDKTLGKPIHWDGSAWNDKMSKFVSAPASATAPGNVGDWSADENYLYVCHATNTWKRVAIAAW
jgi:phage replication-related protein YjqB (UPF0714/DUF867 family)